MNSNDLELLRPIWMPLSYIQDDSEHITLKGWLVDGTYNINARSENFSIHSMDENFKKSLSIDGFRFATHAAQTVHELEKSSAYPNLTSWRIIQTYYAAYFAAHALLRFFGRSFSQLEAAHTKHINDRANSEAGFNPKLSQSYYLISLDAENRNIDFIKQKESHKDLWKCYNDLLKYISSEALSLKAAKERRENLSSIFDNISSSITDRGKHMIGNWLSVVRNEVNYKSAHGVWFPFTKGNPRFDFLMNQVSEWRKCEQSFQNPNHMRTDLERYFITAFQIIDISLAIALDYQKNCPKVGSRSSSLSTLLNLSAAA